MATYTRQILTDGWPTGYGSSLYYTVTSAGGTSRVARTNTGVTEIGGGVYYADVTFNTSWETGRIVWDDGTNYAAETFGERATDADATAIAAGVSSSGGLSTAQDTKLAQVHTILQSQARA